MSRQFTLPVAVAVSFHAFLFLGFTKDPTLVLRPKIPNTDPTPFPVTVLKELEELPPGDPGSDAPKPSASVPTLPEPTPTVVTVEMFTTPIPPSVPTLLPRTIENIPADYGPANGFSKDGKNGPLVFDATKLDNTPRTKFQVSPPYPYSLKAAGITGEVVVEFVVDESGRVLNPRVLRSTHMEFEETTLRAVRQWRFEPGKHNGQAVRFRMSVPVVFNLSSGD